MEPKKYICHFCGNDYDPKRRHVQRFCCDSCRSKAHIKKNKLEAIAKIDFNHQNKQPLKIEKVSLAGVTNAAIGTLAINMATNIFTKQENMPATKKDLENLKNTLKSRFHPILNRPIRQDGARPFYDLKTQSEIYSLIPLT